MHTDVTVQTFKRPLIIAIAIVIPLQELGVFLKSTFTYIAYTLLEEIFCYFMNSPSFHTPTFVSFFFFLARQVKTFHELQSI